MSELRPYAEMKDSGVTWLGDVPAHWKVRRGKTIFRRIDERSATGREELLTVSSDRGVVPRKTVSVSMFKAESYVGYKLCSPGDLVINSLWAWGRGLGISRYRGIISTAYGVYRVRHSAAALPDFIHSLVRSAAFNWELRIRSKGIWISRLQLTDESFLAAALPLPPLPEQTAIARFLDDATNRIERYIRAKEKLIVLLQEQKQVIVHDAVTGRIDVRTGQPYPAYKSSGVEWLGDVPAHWTSRRAKWLFKKMERPALPEDEVVTCFRDGMVTLRRFRRVEGFTESLKEIGYQGIRQGDLVIHGMDAFAGAVGVSDSNGKGTPVYTVCRVVQGRSDPYYYAHCVREMARIGWITALAKGVRERSTDFRYAVFAAQLLPHPPLREQTAIARFLDNAIANITSTIGRTNRGIDLLREFRTRLIADVVTGKLDVRESGTALPKGSVPFEAESAFSESGRPRQQGPIGTGSA